MASAWATKSEYFVLVGFLFGVVIAYLFSAPDVWAFMIGFAQIVGGIFTPIVIFVAIWNVRIQVQAAEKIEKDRLRNEQILVASRIRRKFVAFPSSVHAIASKLTEVLSSNKVTWRFEGKAPLLSKDGSHSVFMDFRDAEGAGLVKLAEFPDFEAFVHDAGGDGFNLCLEMELHVQRAIEFSSRKSGETAFLSQNAVFWNARVVQVGVELMEWINKKHPIETKGMQKIQAEDPRMLGEGWPIASDLLTLAKENPPTSWGEWGREAEKAWHADGQTGDLPVDRR